ncbi:MAG: DUF5673 domain-containing protein [Patescibacteria group bacterium]
MISWTGPEYINREKGSEWYLAVVIITAGIIISAILLKNYIFAVFILLAAFTLILFASKKPRIIEIKINEQGILCDKYFYPFSALESFWIEENASHHKLILKSKKILMPYISLPIQPDEIEIVQEFLRNYLTEEQLHEPILHRLMEYVGF